MRKLLTYFIFPLLIIGLAFLLFRSINEPMKFQKELKQRQNVAVEQLKDIRTLQVTYRDTYGHYAPVMDSLIDFYNNGKITIMRQIGSEDDSTAVLHTEAVKKTLRNLKGDKLMEKLFELYEAGDNNLIVRIPQQTNVRDTLFTNRPGFKVTDLRYIPFSDGDTVIMKSIIKQVSGVDVPLFEAQMPYWKLLKGMDRQQIVNLVAEREDTDRYPGLMVGSIDNANNNAGNWE
ncbi:MAG: hypothetical protein IJP77_07115 [Bacteroidales bacterium]|jgi:hypothetical protein|nr:hypothetical protein [Bacteroidales bacterium]